MYSQKLNVQSKGSKVNTRTAQKKQKKSRNALVAMKLTGAPAESSSRRQGTHCTPECKFISHRLHKKYINVCVYISR